MFQVMKTSRSQTRYSRVLSAVFLLMLSGCSNKVTVPHIIVDNFPIDKCLVGKPEHSLDDRIGMYDISAIGDYFLVAERKMSYFYVLLDESFSPISHFARKGRSSSEYLAPAYYGQYCISEDDFSISIFDRAVQRLDRILINPQTESEIQKESISLPKEMSCRFIYTLKGNKYLGVTDDFDCPLFSSDSSFEKIDYWKPVLRFPQNNMTHQISQNICTVSQEQNNLSQKRH